nr:YetF domain-containing protein [Clostridium folliculivorans]
MFYIAEVEFAILEVDGEISVLKKAPYANVTPQDLNIAPPYKGLTLSLIINGIILDSNLSLAEKNKAWLEEELKKNNITNVEDILYAGYTSGGKLELVTKRSAEYQRSI